MTKLVYNMLWRYKLSRYTIDILSEWDKGRRLKGYYIKEHISTNEKRFLNNDKFWNKIRYICEENQNKNKINS